MNNIIGYVKGYFLYLNKKLLVYITLILSVLIYINYSFKLNHFLLDHSSFWARFIFFTALYLPVFAGTYLLTFRLVRRPFPKSRFFKILLLIAPMIFAAKVALRPSDLLLLDKYFLITMQWPLKAVVVILSLYVLGRIGKYPKPLFGTSVKGTDLKPYFILLGLMVPLIVIAGMGHDFQQVYPKLKLIGPAASDWFFALLFELSYGLDFFTIELFFRGFLILAFIKYAGKDVILPMAAFYCTIHFGKPLAECISSYFGGLILGAIVYKTRSIWGGLIVHLGIAWMMEIVGLVF